MRGIRGKITYVEEIELAQSVIECERLWLPPGYFRRIKKRPFKTLTIHEKKSGGRFSGTVSCVSDYLMNIKSPKILRNDAIPNLLHDSP